MKILILLFMLLPLFMFGQTKLADPADLIYVAMMIAPY
jgi:hypothetical protein